MWLLVIAIVSGVCSLGLGIEAIRPHLVGYMAFVWVIAGSGFVLSRLLRSKRRPSAPIVLGSLLTMGLLILVALPSVPSARDAAARANCTNNLKQISTAIHAWHDDHLRLPDALSGNPPMSWRVQLMLYLEQALFERYDQGKSWFDDANHSVAQAETTYQCPANFNPMDDRGRFFTAYAFVLGSMTAHPSGQGVNIDEITDGTSKTVLVGESCGLKIVWTEPRDIDMAKQTLGVNLPGNCKATSPATYSSYHRGGAMVLFADGHCRFLSNDIDSTVLAAISTASADDSSDLDR